MEQKTPVMDEYFSAATSQIKEALIRKAAIKEALSIKDNESLEIILRDCIEQTDDEGNPEPDIHNALELSNSYRSLAKKELLELYANSTRAKNRNFAAAFKREIRKLFFSKSLTDVAKNNLERYNVKDAFYEIKPGVNISGEDLKKILDEVKGCNGSIHIGGVSMKTEQLFYNLQTELKQRNTGKHNYQRIPKTAVLFDYLFGYGLDENILLTKEEAYDIVKTSKSRNEAEEKMERIRKQTASKLIRKMNVGELKPLNFKQIAEVNAR